MTTTAKPVLGFSHDRGQSTVASHCCRSQQPRLIADGSRLHLLISDIEAARLDDYGFLCELGFWVSILLAGMPLAAGLVLVLLAGP